MDTMKTPIKADDENQIFCNALRSLQQRSPAEINEILNSFEQSKKSKVADLLSKTQFKFIDKQGQVQ